MRLLTQRGLIAAGGLLSAPQRRRREGIFHNHNERSDWTWEIAAVGSGLRSLAPGLKLPSVAARAGRSERSWPRPEKLAVLLTDGQSE